MVLFISSNVSLPFCCSVSDTIMAISDFFRLIFAWNLCFLSFYFQPFYTLDMSLAKVIQLDFFHPIWLSLSSNESIQLIYIECNYDLFEFKSTGLLYVTLVPCFWCLFFSLVLFETSIMILKNHSTFPLSLVYWRLFSIFFLWLPCELDNVLLTLPDNSPR